MLSLKETALAFARADIPVFPCRPGSKQPATENGFHDASCDPAVVAAWWDADPEYNIALNPEAAGWAVIDSDGGEVGEASWAALQAEYGLAPDTYTVTTPSGGVHRYYDGSVAPTVNRLGPKLDTRGRGSYVLIAPSVVDARGEPGKPEKWGHYTVTADISFAPLPSWIGDRLAKSVQKQEIEYDITLDLPANIARAVAKLKALPAVEQGTGADARAYEAAAFMHDLGLSPEKALETMLAHFKCQPQDERYEPFLRRKIESAWTYAQNDAGAWGVTASAADTFGAALDKLPKEIDEPGRKPRFYRYSIAEIAARPAPIWLVDDMIPEKSVGVLFAPSQSYKTYLALDIALTLAVAGKVVEFIAGEGAGVIAQRVMAWCIAHGEEWPATFGLVDAAPWLSDGQMVEEYIEDAVVSPDLVILDTLARGLVGMNENDSKDMGLAIAAMDHIKRRMGTAVMAIHHTGQDVSKGARGSSALHAGMDFMLEIKKHGDDKARPVLELWSRKQKMAAERSAPWTYQGRAIGTEMVLFPTDQSTHRALTEGRQQGLRPESVAVRLTELGAVSEDTGVSSFVLAEAMLAEMPDESPEEHEASKTAMARALQVEAGQKLAAFAHGVTRNLKWWKP